MWITIWREVRCDESDNGNACDTRSVANKKQNELVITMVASHSLKHSKIALNKFSRRCCERLLFVKLD